MKITFRVDASNRIGTGHVVRCLTLADQLRKQGVECRFIHRPHPGHMAETIRAHGHRVDLLASPPAEPHAVAKDVDYAGWLGVSQEQDAKETITILGERQPDWLVVDHYSLDTCWEDAVRPHVGAFAVIDDLANRSHNADLLVDQNFIPHAEARYQSLLPPTATRLCGPRYALLRPEYAEARNLIRPRRGPLSRVLVFYGGADVNNETGRALRVLNRPEFAPLAADVVIGANNQHRDAIRAQVEARPLTTLHGPRPHLVDLMIEADLALGAGGTTTWERCALGLPSIVTTIAENQIPFNEALAEEGIIDYLGHWPHVDDEALAAALHRLLDDGDTLAALARCAWRITDGLGARRVGETILPSSASTLRLRPVRNQDKALYFEWANDPKTRQHAHNPEPISWATHDRWFEARLADPESILWVMETPTGLPVGQTRIDVHEGTGILDYSVDPAFRGRSWGRRLLELTTIAWREQGREEPLEGTVLPHNAASRHAFLRAGFEATARVEGGGETFTDRPLRCRELVE